MWIFEILILDFDSGNKTTYLRLFFQKFWTILKIFENFTLPCFLQILTQMEERAAKRLLLTSKCHRKVENLIPMGCPFFVQKVIKSRMEGSKNVPWVLEALEKEAHPDRKYIRDSY